MGNSSSTQRSFLAAVAVCLIGVIAALTLVKRSANSPVESVERGSMRQADGSQEMRPPDLVDAAERTEVLDGSSSTAKAVADGGGTGTERGPVIASTSALGLRLSVLDSKGTPIEGATVHVRDERWTTDGSGLAEVGVDRPGHYQLDVEGPDPEGHRFVGAELSFDVSRETPWVDETVTLMQPARIVGTFSCTDGSSTREAAVDVCSLNTRSWTNAIADEEGAFQTEWIAPGPVVLYARNGSWSETDLKERDSFDLIEGEIYIYHGSLAPAIELVGTIVDGAGRPLGGVEVDVVDTLNSEYSESVYSADDGLFRVEALYPGEYRLQLPAADPEQATGSGTIVILPKNQTRVDAGNVVFR